MTLPSPASAGHPQLTPEELEKVRTLFQWARSGDPQLATLVRQGWPANLRNESGDSLLMLAAYHGRLDTARALLDAGADPALCNDRGQSPLAGACFKGDLPMVRLLLERGADPGQRLPDGRTALIFAAMFNRVAILELLLAHGADPAVTDAAGVDAAQAARTMGAQDALAFLQALPAGRGPD